MTAKEYLQEIYLKEGITPNMVDLEVKLSCSKEIYRETTCSRRWWDEVFIVVKVNDRLIGFDSATTTGDDSPEDKGWEFDEDSIHFVEEYEETIVVKRYKPIP